MGDSERPWGGEIVSDGGQLDLVGAGQRVMIVVVHIPDIGGVLDSRHPDLTDALRARTTSRVILFGQHTDLADHADARATGLGPIWARSKLLASLKPLLAMDVTE